MTKFYITTAIDYVNAKPHLGHAYEKIIADVLARWQRLLGNDVFFLTGTDENAQKNEQAAKVAKIPVKKFVDENTQTFVELCKLLNISYDRFIRTSEDSHKKVAQSIFQKVFDKGDIYKGFYEGLYCNGCEAFLTEKDLVAGKCPEHNKEPEYLKEESYFFKMSKYEKEIIKLLSDSSFVIPKGKRIEMLNRIKSEGLKDLCVSRVNLDWGIDVPFDKKHKVYVWFDALINYISGLDYPNGSKFKKYWPADIHLIGKGINWFHSVIWPSMLLSAGIKLPKTILVHGYINMSGKKMGKSLGGALDPLELVKTYGVDALRYYLLREISFGEDGDFSEEALKARINNELANDLGNLIGRVLTLVEKNLKIVKKQPIDESLSKSLDLEKIKEVMEKYELHNALNEIWSFVKSTNKYINENKVWELKDKELEKALYNLLESIRIISILINSFIPETSEKINSQIGVKEGKIKDIKFGLVKTYKVKKSGVLFKKL